MVQEKFNYCFQYARITTTNTLFAGKLSSWCSYWLQVVDCHSIESEKAISRPTCPNTDSPTSKTLVGVSPNRLYRISSFSALG